MRSWVPRRGRGPAVRCLRDGGVPDHVLPTVRVWRKCTGDMAMDLMPYIRKQVSHRHRLVGTEVRELPCSIEIYEVIPSVTRWNDMCERTCRQYTCPC